MKKKELEIILSSLKDIQTPSPSLEQYTLPPEIASYILNLAKLNGDIENKRVADLGTGNGILAIGAKLLGAKEVYAIDIAKNTLEVAKENIKALDLDINLILADVAFIELKKIDTVIQNPPFGSQKSFQYFIC